MKIVMIYDEIQSGMGTKDDKMLPLGGKKEAIGPAVMMQSFLKEIDGKVIATLYCGNGTYLDDPDLVVKKLTMMVKKLNPDIVMCGPAFNFKDYALMAAHTAKSISTETDIKAFAAMSVENDSVIEKYKDQVHIVKTPAKGEAGLNDALRNMCLMAEHLVNDTVTEELTKEICY